MNDCIPSFLVSDHSAVWLEVKSGAIRCISPKKDYLAQCTQTWFWTKTMISTSILRLPLSSALGAVAMTVYV